MIDDKHKVVCPYCHKKHELTKTFAYEYIGSQVIEKCKKCNGEFWVSLIIENTWMIGKATLYKGELEERIDHSVF